MADEDKDDLLSAWTAMFMEFVRIGYVMKAERRMLKSRHDSEMAALNAQHDLRLSEIWSQLREQMFPQYSKRAHLKAVK